MDEKDPAQWITKAEILRGLGRFDEGGLVMRLLELALYSTPVSHLWFEV